MLRSESTLKEFGSCHSTAISFFHHCILEICLSKISFVFSRLMSDQ